MRGPAPLSDTEAGEPTVPFAVDETNMKRRPLVCTLPKGFKPPNVTDVPVSWISGSELVLLKSDRPTDNRLNNAPIELPLALNRGPARVTFAGATSKFVSPQQAPVSDNPKRLPPDCESRPLKIELVSWISGAGVVATS
jgi:hypothetical protein